MLEEILQSRRNKLAAKRLLRSLIKRFGLPKRIITDKLQSYEAAKRNIAPGLNWSTVPIRI
nr:DDE-type integrase/transposase/recombinase [Celeribacter ethanolicus]